jgi:4-hydroxyphenylpyruvate dioxygenase
MINEQNPVGLKGVAFVEFSGEAAFFKHLFERFGFSKISENLDLGLELYRQGDINFIVNFNPNSYAFDFFKQHGPCVSGMGFHVDSSESGYQVVLDRGGRAIETKNSLLPFKCIYGIGDAVVYLVDNSDLHTFFHKVLPVSSARSQVEGLGFKRVDHFTNNVPKGEMDKWCEFYKKVFHFRETRYFHIQGKQTGLESRVMRSPCGTFSIPINEPTESKSQIQEYLDEYKGAGVQHLALLTEDIVKTLENLKKNDLQFLSAPPVTYYKMLKERLPKCDEEIEPLQRNGILVDGDEEGYLLQIFSKNVIGPIFFEVIQRKNHWGFGEGNFQALFDSIEADQRERGYL